jgi:CheY-like chemotaxis protein
MAKPEEKTILVVDDEEDIREFLTTVLEDVGFKVVTAADGIEAMEKVKEKTPDFISLDLVMPRKSGIKFLYELRHNKAWAHIPVVIVTAHARDEMGKDDFANIFSGRSILGPKFSLEKPVNPDSYVRLICENLGVECEAASRGKEEEQMRGELDKLIQDADAEKLSDILKMLKKKK